MDESDLLRRARLAFASGAPPPMTLRAGNAADDHAEQPPYDLALDEPTDAYLETFHWGVPYLDPVSWCCYAPVFVDYALRHRDAGSSLVVFALLHSLAPDRRPGLLDETQRGIVRELLEVLGFDPRSAFQEDALRILEEWQA